MILFLNEDRSYLNWIARHHSGFVIDCARHPAKGRMTLHRAACGLIKQANSNREGVVIYIGNEVRAVKWRDWKLHYAW